MPKSNAPAVEHLDPASIAFIAHHAVLRLMMRSRRSSVEAAMPMPLLRRVAVDLLSGGWDSAASVAREHDLIPRLVKKSPFYRFRCKLFQAALEVHADMLADRTLPQMARLDEVAHALRLSAAKTRTLIEAGDIPVIEIAPGEYRIPKAAVADLIAARARKRDTTGRFKAPD